MLSYENHVIEKNGSFTPLIGDWSGNAVIDNMKSMQVPGPYALVKPLSSEGLLNAISFQWDIDFSQSVSFSFDMISILSHQFNDGAIISIKDETGTMIASEIVESVKGRPNNSYFVFETFQTATKLTFEITGLLVSETRIGSIWIGESFKHDLSSDWGFGYVDNSEVNKTTDTKWVNERDKVRVINGTMEAILEDDAFGFNGGQDMEYCLNFVGKSKPVIFIPRTIDEKSIKKTAIYGTLQNTGRIKHSSGPYWEASFEVEEMK